MNKNTSNTEVLLLPIIFLWLGLVLGISFLEAPLKFQAPDVTIKVGLGIGKLVFAALNRFEIVLALLSVIPTIALFKKIRLPVVFMFVVWACLACQSIVILPALHINLQKLLNDEVVAKNSFHNIYIILDLIKIVLLFTVGIYIIKPLLDAKRH